MISEWSPTILLWIAIASIVLIIIALVELIRPGLLPQPVVDVLSQVINVSQLLCCNDSVSLTLFCRATWNGDIQSFILTDNAASLHVRIAGPMVKAMWESF